MDAIDEELLFLIEELCSHIIVPNRRQLHTIAGIEHGSISAFIGDHDYS